MPKIEPNAHVVVDYTLRGADGVLLDSSTAEGGEPMIYVHGYGMIVPGLEKALTGLSSGDQRKITVAPEEGYGERDEELVLEVDRSEMPRPEAVEIGDELVAEADDGSGDEAILRVVELRGSVVVLDGNHPLAGELLHYDVTIREVRPASEDEITVAASGFEEARPETEAETMGLVQLGKSSKRSFEN